MTERMYSENVCKSHRPPVLSQQLEIASLSFEIEIQILLLLLLKNWTVQVAAFLQSSIVWMKNFDTVANVTVEISCWFTVKDSWKCICTTRVFRKLIQYHLCRLKYIYIDTLTDATIRLWDPFSEGKPNHLQWKLLV